MMYIDVKELARLRSDVGAFLDRALRPSPDRAPRKHQPQGAVMPTSDDVMQLAEACAARVICRGGGAIRASPRWRSSAPEEYEDLLGYIHEDELFAPADLDRQEELVRTIQVALPEHLQALVDELVDNQAAQVWLQQEGAFHLGVAIGLRLAKLPPPEPGDDDEERGRGGRRASVELLRVGGLRS